MVWFLIISLVIFLLLLLLAIVALADVLAEAREQEGVRIEFETRRAERRIHDVASQAFQSMLDAAREHDPRGVK